MTISMHKSGKTLFPWGGFEDEIGEGEGRGYNVNVSLPAGTYDEAFVGAFDGVVMPLVEWFDPGVVVLELGMDTLAGDPLTHLRMTNNVVVEVAERLCDLGVRCWWRGAGGITWRTRCGRGRWRGGRLRGRMTSMISGWGWGE